MMIDKIDICKKVNSNGKEYEFVRLWVSGIPFSADNSEYVEKIIKRVATENEIFLLDTRS